jgi:hypothetical protein
MRSLSLTPEQGMATVAMETVVPNNSTPQDAPPLAAGGEEASQEHIYFKDLKLLAHADGEESEEEASAQFEAAPFSDGGSPELGSPVTRSSTVRGAAAASPPRPSCDPASQLADLSLLPRSYPFFTTAPLRPLPSPPRGWAACTHPAVQTRSPPPVPSPPPPPTPTRACSRPASAASSASTARSWSSSWWGCPPAARPSSATRSCATSTGWATPRATSTWATTAACRRRRARCRTPRSSTPATPRAWRPGRGRCWRRSTTWGAGWRATARRCGGAGMDAGVCVRVDAGVRAPQRQRPGGAAEFAMNSRDRRCGACALG